MYRKNHRNKIRNNQCDEDSFITARSGKRIITTGLALLMTSAPGLASADTDLSGVWVLLEHDRPGGLFGAPADPQLSAEGQVIVDAFQQSLTDDAPERGSYCVNSGMPESMFGIAGYPLDIIQREERITLISEFQSEVRRVYLDGRSMPQNYPATRNGYSLGEWITEDGRDVLQVHTALVGAWEVDKWVHSDQVSIDEYISLVPASALDNGIADRHALSADELILQNRITVTDPVMYNGPETVTVLMRQVPDSELLEYNCVEYNWRNALEEAGTKKTDRGLMTTQRLSRQGWLNPQDSG